MVLAFLAQATAATEPWGTRDTVAAIGVLFTGIAVVAAIRGPKRSAELTSAKLEASMGIRVNALENGHDELKEEQVRQWESIGQQGKDIARIEGMLGGKAKAKGV